MKKLRAIVKRPDEKYGHVCHISDTLQNLQNTVGGYIETITFNQAGFVIVLNEEGKLKGLPKNMFLGSEILVGTIIVLGSADDEGNFTDLGMDFKIWKNLVDRWDK